VTGLLAPGTARRTTSLIFDSHDWEPVDRNPLGEHQQPPAGEWDLWLLEAGRGSGKTEACARYFTRMMRANNGWRGRIIAPTYDDAVESCLRGPSGILSMDPEARMVVRPGGTHVLWPNGSEALVLGTHGPKDVDRLRAGGNRNLDWWEEMAANPRLGLPDDVQGAWNQAQLGLRLGEHPHSIASTTPRSTKEYRAIRQSEGVVLTKASMFDNIKNLPKAFIERMRRKYEGTRLGRQELYGELLEDVVGALWTRERLDVSRVDHAPDLAIVVTAVDPAATATDTSDDTGIVTVGIGMDGRGYVLADDTAHDAPAQWGRKAVNALRDNQGDYIVGEVNNGGDMVEHVITTTDDRVQFRAVRASRGKATRAQPVAALWGKPEDEYGPEQNPIVHIVGSLPDLEDQLVTWVPGEEDSPDRLDAMVWGLTELMLAEHEEEDVFEYYEPKRIGANI
jgi:phage terminase large subunit-like protein